MVIDEPTRGQSAIKRRVKLVSRSGEGSKIYIDGEFFPEADAKISVFDHGLLYGDGIFEGIRFYNGRVFRLEEHLERLWDSARSICLEIPMSRDEMTEALLETIRQNDLRDGYIRLIVTRGVGNLGLNPAQCKRPSVIIIATTIALYPKRSLQERTDGGDLCDAPNSAGCAQSGGQVAQLSEQRHGADRSEPRRRGRSANVERAGQRCGMHGRQHFHHQARSDFHSADFGRRAARNHALGGVRNRGGARIKITETDITRHDVFMADECFLTGTAAEVIPVIKADGRTIGNGKPGAITTR